MAIISQRYIESGQDTTMFSVSPHFIMYRHADPWQPWSTINRLVVRSELYDNRKVVQRIGQPVVRSGPRGVSGWWLKGIALCCIYKKRVYIYIALSYMVLVYTSCIQEKGIYIHVYRVFAFILVSEETYAGIFTTRYSYHRYLHKSLHLCLYPTKHLYTFHKPGLLAWR